MRLLFATIVLIAITAPVAHAGNSRLVESFVGTAKGGGNTFPGATVPHGMVQIGPITNADSGGGYLWGDTSISGFALTHLSGIPCSNLGDAPILPVTDPADTRPIPFSHKDEMASPGYYRVRLGNGVAAEMAATARTGTFRFSFPSAPGYLHVSGNATSDRAIQGDSSGPGLCGGPPRATAHYVFAFDQSFTQVGDLLAFNSRTVTVRAAISYTSTAAAWRNLRAENPTYDLAAIRTRATQIWDERLNLIRIAGGTVRERHIFYTALYHSLLSPNLVSDVSAPNRYSNISGWDTYRTQFPLLCLIEPTVARDVVLSLLDGYDRIGHLGRWEYAGVEQGLMVGDPADAMVAEAVAFRVPGIPVRRALAAMVAGATVAQSGPFMYPSRNIDGYVQRPGLAEYLRYGYVPLNHGQGFIWGAVSTTLEYAIADYAISQVARAAGRNDIATEFLARSGRWRNIFDPATGLIGPRLADGSFGPVASLDTEWVAAYTEASGWVYAWMVPHELPDLVVSMGGRKRVSGLLDRFFQKLTGGYGAHADFSNEPSFAAPFVYLATGEPGKASRVVRRVQALFSLAPAGLPGDDDLGATSAWYVWTAIGRYPLVPGSPQLARVTPLFSYRLS